MRLGELYEKYVVEILQQGQVVRTFECISPTATYQAVHQLVDFGEVPDAVTVRVAQISDTVGRGMAAEMIL